MLFGKKKNVKNENAETQQIPETEIKSLDDLKGDPEIKELMMEGKKVKAIQIVRAKTGVDLRTAKDFVEKL